MLRIHVNHFMLRLFKIKYVIFCNFQNGRFCSHTLQVPNKSFCKHRNSFDSFNLITFQESIIKKNLFKLYKWVRKNKNCVISRFIYYLLSRFFLLVKYKNRFLKKKYLTLLDRFENFLSSDLQRLSFYSTLNYLAAKHFLAVWQGRLVPK